MKNLPSVSYSLLLFLFLNTLFLSCSRDNDEIIKNEEPVFQPIQGQVVDYITKEGIPDLDLELIWRDLFEGGVTDRGRTDNNGEFTFYEDGWIEIKNHSSKYQKGAWIDGKYDLFYYLLGTYARTNYGSSESLTIEVYPITRIKINIRNGNPLNSDDKLDLSVSNTSKGGYHSDDPVYTFQYKGIDVNEVFEDVTIKANMVQIDYMVTRAGQTEKFTKLVECTPGGLTEIELEY